MHVFRVVASSTLLLGWLMLCEAKILRDIRIYAAPLLLDLTLLLLLLLAALRARFFCFFYKLLLSFFFVLFLLRTSSMSLPLLRPPLPAPPKTCTGRLQTRGGRAICITQYYSIMLPASSTELHPSSEQKSSCRKDPYPTCHGHMYRCLEHKKMASKQRLKLPRASP